MYTRLERAKENKNRAAANFVSQKKKNIKQEGGFEDNRGTIKTQNSIQGMANNFIPVIQENNDPIQMVQNEIIQLGKKSRKKLATERNAKKKKEAQSQGDRSFNNLCAYRSGWVARNNITRQDVSEFRKTYKKGIRGHASGDNNQGEQGNTTTDCQAYKSWHTTKYGIWL